MSRRGYTGPKLPSTLLEQVQGGNNGARPGRRGEVSRKERRKAERQHSRVVRPRPTVRPERPVARQVVRDTAREVAKESKPKHFDSPKPTKSILKPPRRAAVELEVLHDVEDQDNEEELDTELDADDDDGDSDGSFTISRQAAKAGLADEDDVISALERKLGLKGKKRSAEIGDDELDWLVTGSDSEDEGRSLKRKRPEDDRWLRDKRVKATGLEESEDGEGISDSEDLEDVMDGASEDEDDDEGVENPFSADELSEEDFEGFDSGEETAPQAPPQRRQRENPYVAPVSAEGAPAAKYIPPSLRKAAASDEEALKHLRRQIQGQLNRLSEANLPSILQQVEQIYEKNARQHVTSTLVDLLIGLVSDPSVLNDTFIILHAGFSAAVFKVAGTDFGAQLLEKFVETWDACQSGSVTGKQTLNLIAYLSNLYAFQVVGSGIMYDYIRLLLQEISENNAELLLRVLRTSGMQLRQEDPTALKDIVLLLQRNIAEAGEQNLSVRTKFMVETINNLKNNRLKAGTAVSALAAEHTKRMRQILSNLKFGGSSRATQPLRITLADIRDTEKKGKWWLVGASYHDPSKLANGSRGPKDDHGAEDVRAEPTEQITTNQSADVAHETDTATHTELSELARQHGMNTAVRRAIFIAILSSIDYKHAHIQLMKLNLKSKQQAEIPRVLVHCIGIEEEYNPYYTLIARECCQEPKVKKAFFFELRDVFRRLRKMEDTGESDDEDAVPEMSMSKIVSVGKMYGTLIAGGQLGIDVLQRLEFQTLSEKARTLIEVVLTTILLQVRKMRGKAGYEEGVKEVFGQAHVEGLRLFIERRLAKAELANGKKEARIIEKGCDVALEALVEGAPMADEYEESD